jgi:ubiquinone/menaquinone biosynthesis C-methylase UbiE
MFVATTVLPVNENFENNETIVCEDNASIYDDLYAKIYEFLWITNDVLAYEQVSMQDVSLAELEVASVKVLDMACGIASHASWFEELGVKYTGVDISDSMLAKARSKFPTRDFMKGDISDIHLYPPKSFTHCILLGFAIYEFRNPRNISNNAYAWLQPGGWFIVHAVDPDRYDPVLTLASPFAAFSLQKYSGVRQTTSEIYFDTFKYTGKLIKDETDEKAIFEETFEFKNPSENNGKLYRENKHHLTMYPKEYLIELFKSSGFKHVENVDLVRCGKEYQYLMYFKK